MREYVSQAVEKLAAIGPLAWAPSTTPPLLQLGRVRGSDNDETAFDDGQEEDDEGVMTKGRRSRARRGGRRRRRNHCYALYRPNPSPPLAPEPKSWWRTGRKKRSVAKRSENDFQKKKVTKGGRKRESLRVLAIAKRSTLVPRDDLWRPATVA